MTQTTEQLTARVAELEAHLLRLHRMSATEACIEVPSVGDYVEQLEKQLETIAASAVQQYKDSVMKLAGEPVCRVSTTGIITNQTDRPLEPGLELFTSDQLIAATAKLEAEIERLKDDHEAACVIIADMHAAAMGEVCGPKLGVVEDIKELRQQLAALTRQRDLAVEALNKIKYSDAIVAAGIAQEALFAIKESEK